MEYEEKRRQDQVGQRNPRKKKQPLRGVHRQHNSDPIRTRKFRSTLVAQHGRMSSNHLHAAFAEPLHACDDSVRPAYISNPSGKTIMLIFD
jgi:hypothetical protein